MLGFVQLLLVAGVSWSFANGQPVTCAENEHCAKGFYCEIDTRICQECLRCEDLKREPPVVFPSDMCIKSFVDCGPCLKGLELNRHTDVCVPPDHSPAPDDSTSYLWAIICGTLLFLGVVIAIIVYLLRNPEIFKPTGPCEPRITACVTATAPEGPPPYNSLHYTAVRPESPGYQLPSANGHGRTCDNGNTNAHVDDEDGLPFIKGAPPLRPVNPRVSDANQSATMYNPPNYTQDNPPSQEQGTVTEVEEETRFTVQEEETMPSAWSFSGEASNGDVTANGAANAGEAAAGGASLSALLTAARDSELVDTTPAKKRCVRQEPNNYKNRDSGSSDGGQSSYPRSPSPGRGPPFNFITQITNVVQIKNNN